MKLIYKNIPNYIKYLIIAYLLGILFFTIFRVVFVFASNNLLPQNYTDYIFDVFIMGIRFDTVIITFILCIPFLFLAFFDLLKINSKILIKIISYYLYIVFIVAFMLCAIDIPYFKYNLSRLTVAVFNWMDTPTMMLKFVFSEFIYIMFLIMFFLVSFLFIILLKIFSRKIFYKQITNEIKLPLKITLIFICSLLIFMGMRGRKASPIKEGHACVSTNAFLNQIALNPVFTFVKSISNKISFIDEKLAINEVQRYLKVTKNLKFDSPIARAINPDSSFKKMNVVIVIMESMTANNLKRFGNNNNLTPNIDSIANKGLSFDNIWSAGKHTSNGVYSTLFAFPAIWSIRPTSNSERTKYSGFSGVLKHLGYSTTYFTNHGTSFDNIGEFLPANYFDKIVSQSDYPQDKIVGMYGVPDHVMFEKGIEQISEIYNNKNPFFVTFMTTSNHGPYIIPKDIPFKPKNNSIEKQIVEYADWSIGYFMKMAKKQSWFDNTIFVFVADHGAAVGNENYLIPLNFHHIPFIVYSPKTINYKKFENLGGQIDVFPTIMGLLNVKYINNTFGIDLIKQDRPYIYFSEDNKLVCLNNYYMYVYSKEKEENLFKFKSNNFSNCILENRIVADSMKKYMFTMLQVTQWMIEHKKTDAIAY